MGMDALSRDVALLEIASPPKLGADALLRLERASGEGPEAAPYWQRFVSLLDRDNSYLRTRGIVLLARNARWVEEGTMEAVLDDYLAHITDPKPITARRCLKELRHILQAHPGLAARAVARVAAADFTQYADTMTPLLQKDALELLAWVEKHIERMDVQ